MAVPLNVQYGLSEPILIAPTPTTSEPLDVLCLMSSLLVGLVVPMPTLPAVVMATLVPPFVFKYRG